MQALDLKSRSLILGTSSKSRHALFRTHFPTTPFTSLTPNVDERAITAGYTDRTTAPPSTLTLAIANAKAEVLLPNLPKDALLLTSDQVVVYQNKIREKPQSKEECEIFLKSYASHPVVTVTAVVITDANTGARVEGVDTASQLLLPLPDEIVQELIEKGDVLYCAGGITVEDPLLEQYLSTRTGTLDSIMGLPIALVENLLTLI